MAPAKRYKVILDSHVVYSGPWRTSDVVYKSCSSLLVLLDKYFVGEKPVLVLAFDI